MDKPAETIYPIHELLAQRWSPRAFADTPVEPDKLRSLMEAARWSASSYNEQPWRFVLVTKQDGEAYDKAFACIAEANQGWAKLAPVLIFTFAKQSFSHNQKPNRVALHDIGLAAASITLQATAMGLACHQMGGIRHTALREAYAVPEDFEPVTAIAVGYPGEPELLEVDWARQAETAPRERKPFAEFVFKDTWGVGSDLFG